MDITISIKDSKGSEKTIHSEMDVEHINSTIKLFNVNPVTEMIDTMVNGLKSDINSEYDFNTDTWKN